MTADSIDDSHPGGRRQALIDWATRTVEVPRADKADSFVLHAPLNLMARVGLLQSVKPEGLAAAEAAIETVVERYEAFGPAVAPAAEVNPRRPEDAARQLAAAIDAGDVDQIDALASWLTARASVGQLAVLLGEVIIDSLAGAGHAPIGFHLLQRVDNVSPSLLRGPLRELARHPDWKSQWFRDLPPTAQATQSWDDVIRTLPLLGVPGSTFIFPLMSQIEQERIGPRGLGPALGSEVDVASSSRILLRVAALSMLQGDPDHAPYGWSHCLTMPQGALSLAGRGVEPRTAVAVAATFVAGFRVAFNTEPLGSVGDAAAAEWVSSAAGSLDRSELATFAAAHHDEHLVKYTLACFHAADDDPAWAAVYLRAAAHLADWWRARPEV